MAKYRNWGIVTVLAAMLVLVVRGDLVITGAELSGHVPGTPSSSSLNTDLISDWKMDETSGTRVDSEPTGTAQDLTDNNTVGYTNGVIGNAALFVSTNSESLSREDSSDLSTGDVDFSFALWFKTDSVSISRTILSKSSSVAGDEFGVDIISSKPRFWICNGSTYKIAQTTVLATNNTWHFLVGWHDSASDTVNIQIGNATPISVTTSGMAPDSGGSAFYIGAYRLVAGNYFKGSVDGVGFWKRVLTADERAELYNSGSGKTCCPF